MKVVGVYVKKHGDILVLYRRFWDRDNDKEVLLNVSACSGSVDNMERAKNEYIVSCHTITKQ